MCCSCVSVDRQDMSMGKVPLKLNICSDGSDWMSSNSTSSGRYTVSLSIYGRLNLIHITMASRIPMLLSGGTTFLYGSSTFNDIVPITSARR